MSEIYLDVDVAVNIPLNILPLIDDSDFKTRETGIVYNQAGMDLVWNFVTSAGVMTQTAVTPTTEGVYDWSHVGDAMYKIEIPASGGASINNNTEGYGWFTGICTGVLPWRSPIYCFRAASLNDSLIDGDDYLDVNVVGNTAQTGDTYALLTGSDTELSSVPTTTGSIINKIKFLFEYFRNKKTVDASTETLFKEDSSTTLGTASLNKTGDTLTKGEMNT